LLHPFRHPRPLPSFPTRRSSDLAAVSARRLEGPTAERSVGRGQLPIQAVLFDLDDTLLDTASAFAAAVAAIATEFLPALPAERQDRKSTRLNSSHVSISYAVFCL